MKKSICLKRTFALLFAVIIICGFISTGLVSLAATPVQLAVTSASGKAGDDVTVFVNISANSGLAAGEIYLNYDNTKLIYKSSSLGAAVAGGISVLNNTGTKVNNSYINANGASLGGTLFSVIFTIKPDWSGSTELILTTGDFANNTYQNIPHNISNGTISIGTASSTTTSPSTTPTTTKPASTATATTNPTATTPGTGITAVSTTAQQTTAVPVTIPVEEIIDVLGPDVKDWDKDYANLDNEQKEKIKEHFADKGKPVEITPDGVYYIETTVPGTTGDISSTGSEGDTDPAQESGMTSGRKIFFTLAIVCAILSIAFCVAYISRKKGSKD